MTPEALALRTFDDSGGRHVGSACPAVANARSIISSSYLEGMSGSLSSPSRGSLRNPPDFHIKPLVESACGDRSVR
jgi:hypothetical protein